MNLIIAKAKLFEHWFQEGRSLTLVGPRECECYRGTSTYSWIKRFKPVGAHHHDGGKIAGRQIVHPANQSVHSCTVFMVHLPEFTGLSKCIRFVNQKDNPGMMLASTSGASLGCLLYFRERCREQARHLADGTRASRIQAKGIQRNGNAGFARDRVTKRLRQYCLPCSNIPGENEKGRAVTKKLDNLNLAAVMLCAPRHEALRIKQESRFLQKPIFHFVQAHERGKALCGRGVWKLTNLFEYACLVIHH